MEAEMKSLKPLVAVSAVVVTTAVLLLAASAGAVGRYTDPSGDSNGAPDITGVAVTSAPGGQIVFDIRITNLPSPADVQTYLFINTDNDSNTGCPCADGADYGFVVDELKDAYRFARWNGTAWDDTPDSTVEVRSGSAGALVSVNRSELGNTSGFHFRTRTVQGDASDTAPDTGLWNYSLAVGGPDVRAVFVRTQPSGAPKAGKTFKLTPVGLQLPDAGGSAARAPRPEAYRCSVKLDGKRLAGRGTGGCTVAVPKKAKRKRLTIALIVSYQGVTMRYRLAYRVL
jgi:hypothetical protein